MDSEAAPSLDIRGAAADADRGHAASRPVEAPAGTPSPPPPQPAATTNAPGAEGDPATAGMRTLPPEERDLQMDSETRASATPHPAEEEDTEEARARAEKKRKLVEENKAAQRKRGNRMFGVMLGTLQRAKKQVEQVEDSGAGKKRAELQERLREKLEAERKSALDKADRERELRDLRIEIARREDDLAATDALVSAPPISSSFSVRY